MFDKQIASYLSTLDSPRTLESYSRALTSFHDWYLKTYTEEPLAEVLTDLEVREWRNYLSKTRKFSAATVNQYLAAIRSFVRHYDGTITVRGMAKMMSPISPLNGRELGRLLAITEGDAWLNQRNRALIELMARAGLRVSESVDLRITDVVISPRKGEILVRHGKGMKERKIPLGRQTRQALTDYLKVRPQNNSDWLAAPINLYPCGTFNGWCKRRPTKLGFSVK